MNEEKLKEMAKPNKVGRAREFLQQGRKDEVYGDNEYYRKGFLDGGLYADEHPKNPWRDAKKDPPEVGKNVIGILYTGEIFDMKRTDDNVWFTDILTIDCPQYWMPKPELPKGGEV